MFILHSIRPAWRGSLLPVHHAGQPPGRCATRFNVGIASHPVGAKLRSGIPDGGVLAAGQQAEIASPASRPKVSAAQWHAATDRMLLYKGAGLNPLMRIKFGVRRVGYA